MSNQFPIPVILDTDIGGDIDDTWALVMLLKSPELDLKLVTTCTGDTTYRAKIVGKLLEKAQRTDVAIGIGPAIKSDHYPQAEWVADYDLSNYPGDVYKDGAGALIEMVMNSPEPVTIIAIGPFTTIAEALKREPRIAHRSRIVAMAGNVRKAHGDALAPIPEYNVKIDIPAAKASFKAPWEIVITPLDTCGIVKLHGNEYQAITKSTDPMVQAIMENYRIWCRAHKNTWCDNGSTILFDTVAVYLAFSEQHLLMEDLKITVEDDGLTAINFNGRMVRCANDWIDLQAFQKFLVDRLINGVLVEPSSSSFTPAA